MDRDAVLAEIDDVFARFGATADHPHPGDGFNRAVLVTSVVAAIERNAPNPTYVEAARKYRDEQVPGKQVFLLLGTLASVRQDIDAGYVGTLEQRARETVFDDLLDMAAHIADEIHAAPAVVLAVSVLEEHVRKLAEARGIDTVKSSGRVVSFEDMTNDLARDGTVSGPERKVLAAWYAQRTEAAHGRFDAFTPDEGPRIIDGVRDFLVRHPA